MELTERTIKWILFTMMFLTVPVLYNALLAWGVLPLVAIAALGFEDFAFGLISVVHLIVYCPVLYLVSRAISRQVSAMPAPARKIRVAVVCGLLFGMTFLSVYHGPFGERPRWGNAYYATACALYAPTACK